MSTTAGKHRVPTFHRLTVADVRPDTDESVVVTFIVPIELADDYRWVAGQHVTLRRPGDDRDTRRSYSICSAPGGPLRVGIKRLAGGEFSGWATTSLRAGVEIDVMTPAGGFTTECHPARQRHVVAVAAGSGITPIRSIVEDVLEHEPLSRVTLVFVNRSAAQAMFLDELAALKDRHLDRFVLSHVFTQEPRDADLLSGRLEGQRVMTLIDRRVLPLDADDVYLCGPAPLVDQLRSALLERGLQPSTIHVELFTPAGAPRITRPPAASNLGGAHATITLHGRSTTVPMTPGETVLEATLRTRPEAPYSCRSGACSTCRALLTEGTVEMAASSGLDDGARATGYVLTCQAVATSDRLSLDFDA
ncbi:MAG: 2Fe-2S iron-sulfur cluster-binding protein [Ilumatobacteraceae bacterium]